MVAKRLLCLVLLSIVTAQPLLAGEVVRLKATADVWLSDANDEERNSSSGKCSRFKIKTIQEMAAIRFDASPAKGREVLKATLYLRRAGRDMLRYVRVSTINQDWAEGSGTSAYGPPDGATYLYADAKAKRPWAWPGSQFCDVVMTSGNSVATWAERKELPNGWIAVPLTPELVYALVAGDTDGLAIMDGGNLAYFNNMIHSVQSRGSEPYIEVELGKRLTAAPAKPVIKVEATGGLINPDALVLKVTVEEAKDAFCWRVTVNGEPVERWQVKHPEPEGPTVLYVEKYRGGKVRAVEVVAVSRGGIPSPPAKVVLTAWAGPGRYAPDLRQLRKPEAAGTPLTWPGKIRVWALPGLVKISPQKPEPLHDDIGAGRDIRTANAVWNGRVIRLSGARGEYVSYQICIERLGPQPLTEVSVKPQELKGPGGAAIGGADVELFRNWYARNRSNAWQPAYCVPLAHGAAFKIPDPQRKIPDQQNQTVYVDVYVPKGAKAGQYRGSVTVAAAGTRSIEIRVELTVHDFALPDRLSFWPELNAYRIPRDVHDCYRLAHQHRCVANYWRFTPRLRGSGKGIQVVWDRYDRLAGPLLTGDAFKSNRRAGAPVEVMYLPFEDSWPTPLSKTTYNYQGHWPRRGEDKKWINEHYLKAPYIGDALSQGYKDAFLAVQRQFIEHFREKGYTRTEMQCFYGGKNTHRIQYGVNMWWTTDEPYHWDDWLALQFFCRLWTQGRGGADPGLWPARADISRPQWQGRVLDGIVGPVYVGAGAFSSPAMYRRCRTLEIETGLDLRCYGSANKDTESNTRSVVWLLNAWTNGARAALPWQTLAGENALDVGDRATSGNALIVPGKRFGLPVVGDMRLKALRDGQQMVEYLVLLAKRRKLDRQQLKAMLHRAVRMRAGTRAGTGLDNADALQFSTLKAWQIAELRRRLAELIGK